MRSWGVWKNLIRLVALTLIGGAAPAPLAAQASVAGLLDAEVRELHGLVNAHRRGAGCTALGWHEPTARVARGHSEDMADQRYLHHVSPSGETLIKRLLRGGVTWRGSVGENLAATPAGAGSALELWLDSPPHRRNLENCAFTHHGVGRVGDVWTQVLVSNPRP